MADDTMPKPDKDTLIQDMLSAHQAESNQHPSVDVTRQAIIDALVEHGVIGAREAVDRLIAAVRAEQADDIEWRMVEIRRLQELLDDATDAKSS